MKKVVLISVFIVAATLIHAQKRPTPSLIPPKKLTQTATAELYYAAADGKDLRVVINKINDSSGATNTFYIVHYSIINSGNVDLDISNIVLQGVINRVGTSINFPSGGMMLTPAHLNNTTVLHPGESYQGKMNASITQVLTGVPYKYVLTADHSNRIAEVNESNNTSEVQLQPHKQPDIIPNNLKAVYNTQAGRWEISYELTNSGKNPIDLNYVNLQGYFYAVIPYGPPEGGCGRNVSSGSGPTLLNPGETYTGSFICTQHNLHHGKEYDYSLTFTSNYPVPELNIANNKATVRVIAP